MQRIRRKRETFCYRIAADAVGIGDNKKKKPLDPSSPFDTKQDLNAQREGWNPDKYNNVPEPTGPRMDKMVVTQGMGLPGQSGSGGGGSNTSRPGGGGNGVNSGGRLLPGTQRLNDALLEAFPGTTIGGWREDPNYPNEHPAGKALDFMTKDLSVGNAALPIGWSNGADYAIWQDQMHYPDGRTAPYNGPNPHTDHVHFHHPGH